MNLTSTIRKFLLGLVILSAITSLAADQYPINAENINIRDPFIACENGMYYMVWAKSWSGGTGVSIYKSQDLKKWSNPTIIMKVPSEIECTAVWAPEIHKYRGKWYLFATLTLKHGVKPIVAMPDRKGHKLGALQPRGTWIFASDTIDGTYLPIKNGSITPEEWMCLDGTFFVEDDKPYMVFCHEWCQTGDGRMMLVQLKDDLSDITAKPTELFLATSAGDEYRCVTDGPFIYRSPTSGKLFMTWSNFGPKGYAVLVKASRTNKIDGPWINDGVLFTSDGGHGMLFKKIDGTLNFVLHQPNISPKERMKVFPIVDDGKHLSAGK